MTGGELNGNGAQMKRSTTALFGLIEEAAFLHTVCTRWRYFDPANTTPALLLESHTSATLQQYLYMIRDD